MPRRARHHPPKGFLTPAERRGTRDASRRAEKLVRADALGHTRNCLRRNGSGR